MSKMINYNNPQIPFPSASLEKREFKMQEKMNVLAKINLNKLSKEFLQSHIADINSERIKFIKK